MSRRALPTVLLLLACSVPSPARSAELSLADRVAAHAAIQRVYLAHQEGEHRSLDEVLPAPKLTAQVQDALRQNVALSRQWNVEITDALLSAELDRIARDTRLPDRLQELYDALGNDPTLVLEALVRPQLAQRLAHRRFSFDASIHATERQRAEALREQLTSGALDPRVSHAQRVAVTFVPRTEAAQRDTWSGEVRIVPLDAHEFASRRAALPPAGTIGPVLETDESFGVQVVLAISDTRIELARFSVPKLTWDAWWATHATQFDAATVRTVRDVPAVLPAPSAAHRDDFPKADLTRGGTAAPANGGSAFRANTDAPGCPPDDVWNNRTLDDIPEGRFAHSVIWTGLHMFIWGGMFNDFYYGLLDTGHRYDPATDSWLPVTRVGAPSPRYQHLAAWTGSRMLIWGGSDLGGARNDGYVYNPFDDTWSPMATLNAPSVRSGASAVWVANRFVVWGGFEPSTSQFVNTGAAYDPATNTWSALSTVNAPDGRAYHTAISTGTTKKMVVWGGEANPGLLLSGGVYNLTTGTWSATTTTGAPRARYIHTAVWTGTEMIIWGGYGNRRGDPNPQLLDTGGRYNPQTSVWTASTSMVGQPTPRGNHSAVWTGTRMLIWGGEDTAQQFGTGSSYDPVSDSWTALPTTGAPTPRRDHTAVWTGQEMLIWGGYGLTPWGEPGYVQRGGRYRASTNTWQPMTVGDAPDGRLNQHFAWTGSQLVVWGGDRWLDYLQSGGRFDPTLGTWLPMSTTNAPPAQRWGRSSVWSGSELLIWGGKWNNDGFTDGHRYNPLSDSWSPITATDAPEARSAQVALWTGSRMLIWGGDGNPYGFTTGGLYDPTTDHWTATSTVGAPRGRANPAAAWLGTEMFVWGGRDVGIYLNDGALYNPATGVWRVIAASGAPEARQGAWAVWTGRLVLVLSGSTSTGWYIPTGARYEPAKDRWTPMAPSGAVEGNYGNAPVWTGTHLLAWGGAVSGQNANPGRLYDPISDHWTSTGTFNAPEKRSGACIVWMHGQVLIWGGRDQTYWRDGGYWGIDSDGDGAGDSCDCAPADGSATGAPGEIGELEIAADRNTLHWVSGAFAAGTGTTHDVLRGRVAELPVNTAASTCVAAQWPADNVSDSTTPLAGDALWYLVRGRNVCAQGSYGFASNGTERISQACP